MAELLTLDSWFARRPTAQETTAVRAATNLAADLLTDQTDDPTSVFAGDAYGCRLSQIRRELPGGTLALTAEAQRVTDRHAAGAQVSVAGADLRIGVNILLTAEGFFRG